MFYARSMWRVLTIEAFDELASSWDRLNDAATGLPFLSSLFVRNLLRVFRDGSERLVVLGAAGEEQVIGIVRRGRLGAWETYQPSQLPLGTPLSAIRAAAADRAPLRGTVRVIVVLVQFSDHAMAQPASHFNELFFSTGVLPHGSVKEYYRDVTGGLIDITGEVVGPFQLPQTIAWYANGNFGIGRPGNWHAVLAPLVMKRCRAAGAGRQGQSDTDEISKH